MHAELRSTLSLLDTFKKREQTLESNSLFISLCLTQSEYMPAFIINIIQE